MTNAYRAVQWNRHKLLYDLIMVSMMVMFIATFVIAGRVFFPPPEDISLPILLIRGLGVCAIVMLHLILIIGPLARLTPLAAPLLYNRRHLGVAFFMAALLHALLVIAFYGGFGSQDPVRAVLAGTKDNTAVPFEFLGLLALIIFALMASTSHDYWLKNLGLSFWKSMHMFVYLAYILVIAHVVFGQLRNETNIIPLTLLSFGALVIASLHLISGLREVTKDHHSQAYFHTDEQSETRWVDVCAVDDIKPDRAIVVQVANQERIAVFRTNNAVSAISNVCAHQGGPLGEGKVIDGCVTCPWHGYQYKPACGQSPPPYTEKIPTYDIRIEGRRVLVNPEPNPPGTHVEPAPFDPWNEGSTDDEP